MSRVGDKLTIAQVRARRTDPVWRRRHKVADISGIALVVAVLVGPFLLALLWRPLGAAAGLAIVVGGAAALAASGPKVGLERRAALLVAIPILGLFVVVPAVWRAAHLHLQRWQGPLEPPWSDTAWLALGVVGVVCWVATVAGLVLSLV